MARWNDLPTELKGLVVEMIDDEQDVRYGRVGSGHEEFDALLALSTIDRDLLALVAPILWHISEAR